LVEKDLYKTLGVKQSATKTEIKRAFRKLAQKHHPDKVGARGGDKKKHARAFKSIADANEVLSNENDRAEYDE
ncbi:DnaJ domain-containing protein, partial [Ochromonadaceae sp. CCMP2298]